MSQKQNYTNKEATIDNLEKQVKCFPRFDAQNTEKLEDIIQYIKKKFPWGCDQLETEYVRSPKGFCLLYADERNIGISLKYGIISGFSKPMQLIDSLRCIQPNCLIFLGKRNYLYAIAKVVSYEPDKTFKYWSQVKKNQQNHQEYIIHDPFGQKSIVRFSGVFKVKFVKLGYVNIAQQKMQLYSVLSPQAVQSFLQQFEQDSVKLDPRQLKYLFQCADKAQEESRKKQIELWKNNSTIKTIYAFNKGFKRLDWKQKQQQQPPNITAIKN